MKTKLAKETISTNTSEASSSKHHNKSMGNDAEQKREDKEDKHKERLNIKKKEVFISVYVESPSPNPIHVNKKAGDRDIHESNKSMPLFVTKRAQDAKTRDYDRRSQLLAYAQELRLNINAKRPECPKTDSKPMPKEHPKISLDPKSGVKRKRNEKLKTRVRTRKRYQQLVPEVDISCRPKSIIVGNNKKSAGRTNFLGSLKRVLTRFCREQDDISARAQCTSK